MDNLSTLILDCIQKNNVVKWVIALFRKIVFWIKQILSIKPKTESMKLQIYKNIDVVQINVKAGVSEYFLPQNVDWADKVVEKIVLYTSILPENKALSPIDGVNPILCGEDVPSIYFDFYSQDEVELAHNLSAQSIVWSNNHPVELNSKISLRLSRMFFSEPPVADGCVLLYVFWGNKTVETEDLPQSSVTIQFEISKGEDIALSQVIDTYIHAQGKKLKGINFWGGEMAWQEGLFITLRDYNYVNPIVNTLPLAMCRPLMSVDTDEIPSYSYWNAAQRVQIDSLYLDDADIDFDNSFIHKSETATTKVTATITFLY